MTETLRRQVRHYIYVASSFVNSEIRLRRHRLSQRGEDRSPLSGNRFPPELERLWRREVPDLTGLWVGHRPLYSPVLNKASRLGEAFELHFL